MPVRGTLRTWNDERGFGFITPDDGGQDCFVHISAFPRDAPNPSVGESVLYEAGYDKDGRTRATRVFHDVYLGASPEPSLDARSESGAWEEPTPRSFSPITFGILLLLAAGGYILFSDHGFADHDLKARGAAWFSKLSSRPTAPKEPNPAFSCDGRIYCSQMTSCREATFFLQNCPGTRMDGDQDGIPCEGQFCSGSFAY